MSFNLDDNLSEDISFTDMFNQHSQESKANANYLEVSVDSIRRYPHNRPISHEDVQPLIDELEVSGWELIHPVVVRPISDEQHDYEIIAGERRWTAFKLSNRSTIKIIIKEDLSEEEVAAVNISENIHHMPDKIHFLAKKIKRFIDEFKVKKSIAAKRFGMDAAQLSRLVNHIYRVDQIPEINAVYKDGNGITDSHVLTAMVKIYNQSPEALKESIAFAQSHNCLSRKYFDAVLKMDLADDISKQLTTWNQQGDIRETSSSSSEKVKDPAPQEKSEEKFLEPEDSLDADTLTSESPDESPDTSGEKHESDISGSDSHDESNDLEEEPGQGNSFIIDDIEVTKRPMNQADIVIKVKNEDCKYFLAKNYRSEDQTRIVLQNLRGELKVVLLSDCTIENVM